MINFIKNIKLRQVILFLIVTAVFIAFGFYFINSRKPTYNEKPQISIPGGLTNKFSVTATDEDLLAGITADDREDGDITSNLMIESLSPFVDGQKRIVTYVVFDSSNNVTKIEREIEYTDYTSPKIVQIKKPKIHNKKVAEILDCYKAVDVIDGDISGRIRIDTLTVAPNVGNIYHVTLLVSNSCGDITRLSVKVELLS